MSNDYKHSDDATYHQRQAWLNLQSNPDELWDVRDENGIPTGRLHRRGDPMPEGEYHLTVHVWIQRADGRFLLTQRSPNKGYPLMWEVSAGSAVAGDDSLTAALREVREESGLILKPENGQLIRTDRYGHVIADMWYFQQEFALEDVVLLEGETCDVIAATKAEILQLDKSGQFVPIIELEQLLNMMEQKRGI